MSVEVVTLSSLLAKMIRSNGNHIFLERDVSSKNFSVCK